MFKVLAQIDSPDNIEIIPIVESDEVFAFDCKKSASEDSFVSKCRLKCFVFTKVPIDLHSSVFKLNSKRMRLSRVMRRPHQIATWSKSSILKLWVSINDEIIVTNDSEITTSWSEFDSLGKCFT